MLVCPVCGDALTLEGRSWRCGRRHTFDRARAGYVNLLPVGHGRSGIRGDDAAMARARRRFLARPHYEPLTRRLVETVRSHLDVSTVGTRGRQTRAVVAEAGCGTGHYIGAVTAALPDVTTYGFDVSADALRLAARDHPSVTFAVNDLTHRICLADGCVDVLLNVFAPRNATEFGRVLDPDGLLLVVVPGEGHLRELRRSIPLLDIPPDKVERTRSALAPAFTPTWSTTLEYDAMMTAVAIVELVSMTPSAHHLDEEDLAPVRALASDMRVTLSFEMLGFRPSEA